VASLCEFADSIWIIDGPPVRFMAVNFPTRMVIARLSDGSLWVNSPVPAELGVLEQIAEQGPVRYLVAPTKLHLWRLEEWHALFPEATLWASPQIPNKFKRWPFAGVLGDQPPSDWAEDFDQLIFKGNLFVQEAVFFHKKTRTIIVADFIQNHPVATDKPKLNALWKIAGVLYPNGGVPLDIRLTFTARDLARRSLQKLLSWDFDKLIIGHGVCLERDAKAFIQHAFRWL
jgi:hypothetical protein